MALKTSRGQKKSRLNILKKPSQSLALAMILAALSFSLFLVESHRAFAQPNNLKIWFFDIGQGDAIFIETPNRYQILIDGGPDKSVLAKLGSVMLPWDRSIDAVIFTHPDADHITGLPAVLDRYQVDAIYETGLDHTTSVMQSLEAAIASEAAEHYFLAAPRTLFIDGVRFDIISPSTNYQGRIIKDNNAASLVIKLTYGETSLLLTGDAEVENEILFGPVAGDIDVLKTGHHGSLTSTSVEFLDAVTPEVAIISVGEDNRYGHPHPAVLQRLKQRQVQIFRTDQDGDILLISNGGEPEVFAAPLPF